MGITGKIYTPEELTLVKTIYEETQRVTAVREHFDWSTKIAQRAIKLAGVQKRIPRFRDDVSLEVQKQVRPLYDSGLTAKKIGELIGLHEKVVVRILKDEGGETRIRPPNVPEPVINLENRFQIDDMTEAELEVVYERYYNNINQDNVTKCIEWTGSLTPKGYGYVTFRGGSVIAHRLMYTLYFLGTYRLPAPLTRNIQIRHMCNNPSCVNPLHLKHGTAKQNYADQILHGSANPLKGEDSPFAKLTNQEAMEVLILFYLQHTTIKDLASIYEVGPSAIIAVTKGDSFQDVQNEFNELHPEFSARCKGKLKGEKHPAVFISDENVYNIISRRNESVHKLAEEFGCRMETIYGYWCGRNRGYVKEKWLKDQEAVTLV